jgi:site-specific DNA-cytosine methylase
VIVRPPVIRAFLGDEVIADNFAGGGGASLGIELALGRSPDLAVNHDAEAIAMHRANHPTTRHYTEEYVIVDIGMRMLTARELFRAQGFDDSYQIDPTGPNGKPLTKTAQIRMCGNSVCPPIAAAIVRAQFPEAA